MAGVLSLSQSVSHSVGDERISLAQEKLHELKKKEKKQKMRNKKMGIEESADLITGVLPD